MGTFLMYFFAVASVALVIYLLIKKADIKITLFAVGVLLLYVGIIIGIINGTATEIDWLSPLNNVADSFKSILGAAGLIILILGGYTAYMSTIGANNVTVWALTKPLKKIKSPYILVPFVFLVGNLLSLVIPSASNLAIILLATLYPVLRASGMSRLTSAAVIATTATVMPTPLGGDNVAIAEELAQYLGFENLTATSYVFGYHALVSIPTLIVMAVVHYFWQKHCDKVDIAKRNAAIAKGEVVSNDEIDVDASKAVTVEGSLLFKIVYAMLPVFPIIILLVVYLIQLLGGPTINVSVILAVLISFVVAIVCELIRNKGNGKKVIKDCGQFFDGMGKAFGIVVLLVSATVFVNGLKSIGIIAALQAATTSTTSSGILLPLILVILSALIVLLSGSGTALFYAMVPLMYPLAVTAGISVFAVSVPMGLAGNLIRAVSPVSAVIMIVAGATKLDPSKIVKRTSVPMFAGVAFMFVLSMILFL